jgi:hypothetical protein
MHENIVKINLNSLYEELTIDIYIYKYYLILRTYFLWGFLVIAPNYGQHLQYPLQISAYIYN